MKYTEIYAKVVKLYLLLAQSTQLFATIEYDNCG